jgi:hypothetical protein
MASLPSDLRFEKDAVILSEWGAHLYVSADFRGCEEFHNATSAYTVEGGSKVMEYHVPESFATDWTLGSDWESFYMYVLHASRDLLIATSKSDPERWTGWTTQLESWLDTPDKKMFWIYGVAGFDPQFQFDSTPLHRAAYAPRAAGPLKLLKAVLGGGLTSVNSTDNQGRTALHMAALAGNKEICATLLQADIDVSATNGQGQTALEVVEAHIASGGKRMPAPRLKENQEIVTLLKGGVGVKKQKSRKGRKSDRAGKK